MDSDFDEIWDLVVRLLVAMGLGAALGLDRELKNRAAGLRTHMLVALGAAMTTIIGEKLYEAVIADNPGATADPLRVIEGVIAAIGFIGTGAILQGRRDVSGLTTAANIWICGAVGMAAGAGYHLLAAIGVGCALVALTLLAFVQRRMGTNKPAKDPATGS
jgi:putative Mg2+ transporter-C (MgtC) family protein